MGVKLSWTNRGADKLDSIRIYRSATKTGVLTLIDTIAGNALAYEDMSNPPSNTVLCEETTDIAIIPTFSEIQAAGVGQSNNNNVLPATVYKWVIGGKIIFIPASMYGYYSIANLLTYKVLKPFGNNAGGVQD
ncbi:hypothetical protein ACTFIV_007905 [Dictyostelium citrinum]